MKTVSSSEINYNNNQGIEFRESPLDLSTGLSETEEIKQAIEQAEAAMAAPAADKPLVPVKKAAKKGKAGRIVGISKDENELLQNLLQTLTEDPNYSKIVLSDAFAKIQARYNK